MERFMVQDCIICASHLGIDALVRHLGNSSFPSPSPFGAGPEPGSDPEGDAMQPATDRFLRPDGPRPGGKDQESGLEGVLGVVRITDKPTANGEDHGAVPQQQAVESGSREAA
jgi:hypothetical protein